MASQVIYYSSIVGRECWKVEEYDDALVRNLIERITVYDDYFTVEFKSGIEIDVRL